MSYDGEAWLGVDLGTQSVRALLVTGDGTVLGSGAAPLRSRRTGVRHEQDPGKWWDAVCTAVSAALAGRPAVRIGALAVCATSGTVLLTDASGRPLTPGLMYDDGRAAADAERLRAAGIAVQDTWGLPKALWLVRAARLMAREFGAASSDVRNLRLAHQCDVITARLTGHPTPTDAGHALKSGYDPTREAWPDLTLEHALEYAQLPLPDGLLPEVVRPGTRLGEVCATAVERTGIPAGTPVIAGTTDGCAAQIASGALREGSWNSVLGTTLVLKGASSRPVRDPTGVLYNHRSPDGSWLPGGASAVGGGALTAYAAPGVPLADLDRAAAAHEPASVLAYPLTSPGERFPFRAPDATALLLGTPASDADLWAALLQGIGYAERLCLDHLHHLGAPLHGPLTFTGGAARSAYWNQLRADILGRPVHVPEQTEPALGMAALAAYGMRADGGASDVSLADTAERVVRIRTVLDPRPHHTARFTAPYARLLDELEQRGWLPAPLATHARTRLDTLGSPDTRDTSGP